MKLKYIAIFALAFAICAGWNLLFDAPKTAKPAVETAAKLQEEKEPQGSWPAPLRPPTPDDAGSSPDRNGSGEVGNANRSGLSARPDRAG